MEELRKILEEIHDEADHIVGTEADNHKAVAIEDAKRIKEMAKKGKELLISLA